MHKGFTKGMLNENIKQNQIGKLSFCNSRKIAFTIRRGLLSTKRCENKTRSSSTLHLPHKLPVTDGFWHHQLRCCLWIKKGYIAQKRNWRLKLASLENFSHVRTAKIWEDTWLFMAHQCTGATIWVKKMEVCRTFSTPVINIFLLNKCK